MLLTDRFKDEYGHLKINMAFDNILRMFELFEDKSFNAFEQMLIALEMLVINYDEVANVGYEEQFELFKDIMREVVGIDMDSEMEDAEKIMDFKKDAELIYTSFLSEYGIDLFDQQGEMHWKKFSVLLANLGDETAFKQVVSYRVMKVPSSKEATAEYREHVRKMKKIYSLEEKTKEVFDNKLDKIADIFKR